MVGSNETPHITNKEVITTNATRKRFLSLCITGFWPPEDENDVSLMSFSWTFIGGAPDILRAQLIQANSKAIVYCMKCDRSVMKIKTEKEHPNAYKMYEHCYNS